MKTVIPDFDDLKEAGSLSNELDFPFDDFPEVDGDGSKFETSEQGHKVNLGSEPDPISATFPEEDQLLASDSMLGMIAYEIQDANPQLNFLAQGMLTEDEEFLKQQVDSYLEIVARIGTVAEETGLAGLTIICQFIRRNTILLSELALDQRVAPIQLLEGWAQIVIAHLSDPMNDSLCLAVVDYLEIETWPEPLAYRDVRGLIDGLTVDLESSGDFAAEQREVNATAEDVSLELSSDASMELIDAFFAESPGHAETFSSLVVDIAADKDVVKNTEAAQRIAHTLKGSGNLVGVKGIANLAHHIEDIFEYISKEKISPPEALSNTMLEAADTIESMLDYLQGIGPMPRNSLRVLQNVLDWANKVDAGSLEKQH